MSLYSNMYFYPQICNHMRTLLLSLTFLTSYLAITAQTISDDEKKLRILKEEWWPRAYQTQDMKLLDRILADEFQMIDADGNVFKKSDELDYIRQHKPAYDSFEFKIERLDIFENGTAIVSGTGIIQGKDTEGAYITTYRSSNVLIKRNKDWKAISSHVSGIHKIKPGESSQ